MRCCAARRWCWPTTSPRLSGPRASPRCRPRRPNSPSARRRARQPCSIAPAARADRYAAAAANGAAATWCELDEGYRLAPAHAGAYILPALLAEAEATGADTLQVLHALTLGYEIVGRCAQAFPFAAMTVHPHAAFGTLGAAAGIGLLRGYDADTLLATVSAGASMVFAGPYNHALDGALVRNLWTGLSAWTGMRAADLAPLGLGGIAESTYDVFVGCFGTRADPPALTAQLGERWAIASGYHKLFACCQYAHSAVEASLALGEKLVGSGRTSDDIAEITVETHPRGLTLTETEPADRAFREVLDAARAWPPWRCAAPAGRAHSRPTRSMIRRSHACVTRCGCNLTRRSRRGPRIARAA